MAYPYRPANAPTPRRVSELAPAVTLTGAELVPLVQGGQTVVAALSALLGLSAGPFGSAVVTATGGSTPRTIADWLAYLETAVVAQNFTPSQTFKAVPAYSSSDATTVVKLLDANPNRRALKIVNNGTADAELWYGLTPNVGQVNQTIKQGEVAYAGGGGIEWTSPPASAVYATAVSATGLSIMEG